MSKMFEPFLFVVLAFIIVMPIQGHASLTEDDQESLTSYLQILSEEWVDSAVYEANQILWNTSYDRDDWEEFFSGYFANNPFTHDLWLYIHLPVFYWGSDEAHINLQEGMIPPLLSLIEDKMDDNTPNLGQALAADEDLRDTLFRAHGFMAVVSDVTWRDLGAVSDETRNSIYDFYTAHVEAYPEYLKKSSTIDTSAEPYVGALQTQVHMNLRNFLGFYNSLKDKLTETLDIQGTYLEIWDDFSVLVLDNNGLDEEQLSVIYDVLDNIPNGLHILGGITQNDLLGNTGDTWVLIITYGTVNIFDIKVGAQQANPFPADVPPKYSDVFTLVLVHELNHQIDAYTISNTPRYSDRKSDLIDSAGCAPMNYLRSMFRECFFYDNPQEFFASISNQWFSSTEKTLELALLRFDKGYNDPINQFLFFADVYYQEGCETYFYEMNSMGSLTREASHIERDTNENINSISTPKGKYLFTLDSHGNVIDYHLEGTRVINIDIKPGSDPNAINPRSRGVVPVAILTTDTFDATAVDEDTVAFGPDGAKIVHPRGHVEDVDSDGDLDLLLHFRTQETGIQCGDPEASLWGETFDEVPIKASDSIVTVGNPRRVKSGKQK